MEDLEITNSNICIDIEKNEIKHIMTLSQIKYIESFTAKFNLEN